MRSITPTLHEGAHLVILAVAQDQYDALAASVDDNGLTLTEWVPSAEELQRLFCGGHVRLWTHTFGQKFQPVSLEVIEPESVVEES